jgi:hypothetical protein
MEIDQFNAYFPELPLEVIGISEDETTGFQFVIDQPLCPFPSLADYVLEKTEGLSREEFMKCRNQTYEAIVTPYMEKKGLRSHGGFVYSTAYENDEVEFFDFHLKNIHYDPETGTVVVIDCNVELQEIDK